MYKVCYAISQIHPTMGDDMLIALNEAAVMGLAGVDRVLLDYYEIPSIYYIAPKYRSAVQETWKDIGAVIRDGWGDCKDFTAWRLAELWKQGIQAKAESIVGRKGRKLMFHTYVRYANGRVEDPAKQLGMP